MEFLRKIVSWISRHRYLGVFIVVVLVVVSLYVKTQVANRQGMVSEPLKKGTIIQSVYGIGTVKANRRSSQLLKSCTAKKAIS